MAKALEHPAGMLRLRGRLAEADVAHYQWLRPADRFLLPPKRPRVMTVHNVLRRSGAVDVAREMDAVVVHTRHGARELEQRVGRGPRAHPGDPPRRVRAHAVPARTSSPYRPTWRRSRAR